MRAIYEKERAPNSSKRRPQLTRFGGNAFCCASQTLVAPIWNADSSHDGVNVTSRTVWIPPGQWTDAWTGASVSGPKNVSVSQPVERIPLWHKAGGPSEESV